MPIWPANLKRFLFRRRRPSGTLVRLDDVPSVQLGNARRIDVYLPPSYARSARRFPVIYMQDGQNLFDRATSHAGDWGLRKTLDDLAVTGLEPIIVGIWNTGEQRLEEYSPFVDPKNGGGRGDLYLAFLIETVKPLIDRQFRTEPERAHTGIAGSSMGGLISLYGFFRHPAVFGFVGALSPSLWFADAAIFPFLEAAPLVPGRIYFDAGDREPPQAVADVGRLRDLLVAKGYRPGRDFSSVEDPQGAHDEAAWGRRFRHALPFLLTERGAA
jgi:predicted alpha/beta superfamily hydrolase